MKLAPTSFSLAACLVLAFTACERKTVEVIVPANPDAADPVPQTRTFETAGLKSAIDTYEKMPTTENAADVRKAFAKLDGEIAELEGHVARKTGNERAEAAQKLANLTTYRTAETARFAKAQATAGVAAPTADITIDSRSGAQKAEDAARNTGDTLKNAAEKAGDAIKDAGKKAGDAIKEAGR
jgi:hypothetical protein